jgi:hypothetical protein
VRFIIVILGDVVGEGGVTTSKGQSRSKGRGRSQGCGAVGVKLPKGNVVEGFGKVEKAVGSPEGTFAGLCVVAKHGTHFKRLWGVWRQRRKALVALVAS